MTRPDTAQLRDVLQATWPPAKALTLGPWTLRVGQGGGKRVSAATATGAVSAADIASAEAAMQDLSQPELFQLGQQDSDLDAMLDASGYDRVDPTNLYVADVATRPDAPPPVSTFIAAQPIAAMREIWAAGGIGPERLAVMARARGPKAYVLGRTHERAAGTGFVAIYGGIAMVHALEVAPAFRRRGVARNMMARLWLWALQNGATHVSLAVIRANVAGNALYRSLGMAHVGQYHYRMKPGRTPA